MATPAVVEGRGLPTASSRPAGCLDVFLLALNIPDRPDDSAERSELAGGCGSGPFLPASNPAPVSVSLPVNLLAVRECVEFTADPLVFGNGSAPIHVGPPAHCLSLWAVPGHGVVLACEDWTADPVEGLADWRASGVDGAVDRLLASFGFTTATRLRDVFPEAHAVLPNVRLADLVAGTGHERASAGLVVAVREDAGAILLDLEAVAADHDHAVFGVSEMIRALVPWVAVRARHAADYRLVLDHLRDHAALEDSRLLAALDDVAAVQARRMERVLLVAEARHDGAALARMAPAQLRTVLVRRLSTETAALDAELGEATRVIERALLRSAERRGHRHSRIAQAWSVAAGVIAVVAVFAALAAVPAVDQPTLFGHWLEALAATIAITAGVIVVVVAWRRPPGR
ncbi:hypothetical protein GS485_09835 [Rhodococcus hoagii]|nr:hypothetical protein [Prescottella equi]NKS77602.1 hypothetical protein [Prescottella equi]NKT05016.1 hypothetical protein [Prescottella equi]